RDEFVVFLLRGGGVLERLRLALPVRANSAPFHQPLATPRRSALILAMTFAASDSTRTTRTPAVACSISRIAVVMASRSVAAVRSNSTKATPSRRFNSMSPWVAAYRASASSGVSSATPQRIKVKVWVFMIGGQPEDS